MSVEIEKHEVSNRLFTLLVVFLIGISVFFGATALARWNEYQGYTPRTISVDAVGKAYVSPDVAILNLGVTTEGKEVKAIVAENTKKVNAIIAALKEQGVEAKDIQTTNYNVYPKYRWTEAQGQITDGYTLNQDLTVKIRDFNKTGAIIEKATGEGANTIGNLQFTVEDSEKYKTLAREDAIKKIEEKTKAMHKAVGIKFGKVVSMYEYEDYSQQPMMYAKSAYDGMGGVGGGMAESAPSIQPGQNEISLRVTLEYRIK